MPICRGCYIVFNIDFDVIEDRTRKKLIPHSSGGTNTAINFSYVFVTSRDFFNLPHHQNM